MPPWRPSSAVNISVCFNVSKYTLSMNAHFLSLLVFLAVRLSHFNLCDNYRLRSLIRKEEPITWQWFSLCGRMRKACQHVHILTKAQARDRTRHHMSKILASCPISKCVSSMFALANTGEACRHTVIHIDVASKLLYGWFCLYMCVHRFVVPF